MRREEGEKTGLRFPQTFEAAALVSIYINCKEFWELVVVPGRKPLDGAYAPSVAGTAMRPAGGFFFAQKIGLFAQNKKRRPLG